MTPASTQNTTLALHCTAYKAVMGHFAPVMLSDNGSTQQLQVTVPAGVGVNRRFVRLRVQR